MNKDLTTKEHLKKAKGMGMERCSKWRQVALTQATGKAIYRTAMGTLSG